MVSIFGLASIAGDCSWLSRLEIGGGGGLDCPELLLWKSILQLRVSERVSVGFVFWELFSPFFLFVARRVSECVEQPREEVQV